MNISDKIKLRCWAEYLPQEVVMREEVVNLLKKYNVNLSIATPYGSLDEKWANFLRYYEEQGVEVALWLLLPDSLGYWPSERNADEFSQYLDEVFQFAKLHNLKVPWIAVDLEMPIYQGEKVLRSPRGKKLIELLKIRRENKNLKRFKIATKKYEEIQDKINNFGAKTLVAAHHFVLDDVEADGVRFQDIMETPVSVVKWDVVSFMIYNSMNVGYTRGFISPADAHYLLYDYAIQAKKHFQNAAGVSIGVTDIGKLGDEPYYQEPYQMIHDVEATKAAGILDIAIYNMEGVLKAKNPADWFEIVLNTPAKVPPPTLRAKILKGLLRLAARLL